MLECRHELHSLGPISVVACATCETVQFWSADGPLDPAEGVSQLFGMFTRRTAFAALRAPGPEAIVYDPPNRAGRATLAAFPTHVWLETQPGLWMSTDGTHLLLSPAGPAAGRHLGQGA